MSKLLYFDSNVIEMRSQETKQQKTSIGLDHFLAPNRRHDNIWIKAGLFY